ncbi:Hypothetical predicted protein, partial [Pelobates cultripes]
LKADHAPHSPAPQREEETATGWTCLEQQHQERPILVPFERNHSSHGSHQALSTQVPWAI